VIAELRKSVAGPGPDRFISPELEAADTLVRSGKVSAVAKEVFAELR
jgi:histidine ammonia-lyase